MCQLLKVPALLDGKQISLIPAFLLSQLVHNAVAAMPAAKVTFYTSPVVTICGLVVAAPQ